VQIVTNSALGSTVKLHSYLAILACAVLALPSAALAQPGSLDTSFGGDGRVTTDFNSKADFGAAVAIQADGNIVLAGGSGWDRPNPNFAVARYLGS
jgi:hypothetical protein